jgi:hypothetical protein
MNPDNHGKGKHTPLTTKIKHQRLPFKSINQPSYLLPAIPGSCHTLHRPDIFPLHGTIFMISFAARIKINKRESRKAPSFRYSTTGKNG